MVLLPDFLDGCQTQQIRLRLPEGEIALPITDIRFGHNFLDVVCHGVDSASPSLRHRDAIRITSTDSVFKER